MNEKQICQNCRFFETFGDYGECKFNAPQVRTEEYETRDYAQSAAGVSRGTGTREVTFWPKVNQFNSCGQWKEKT